MAIQGTAGVTYALSSNLDLGAGYKVLYASGYDWILNGNFEQSVRNSLSQAFLASVCLKF